MDFAFHLIWNYLDIWPNIKLHLYPILGCKDLELVISNDDNNSPKESKVSNYHWPAHNSVNFEFAYSILHFLPSTNVPMSKNNVLPSLETNKEQFWAKLFQFLFIGLNKKFTYTFLPLMDIYDQTLTVFYVNM